MVCWGRCRVATWWRGKGVEGVAVEVYPDNPVDSGQGSKGCYVVEHDLADVAGVHVEHVWGILHGRIHGGHLGTPCRS